MQSSISRTIVSVGLVCFTATAFLLVTPFCVPHFCHGQEPDWLPSEPLQGRIVFEEKHCTMCHSIAGTGGDIGPDLAESYFDGTFLDLASIFWNHVPDMVVEYKRASLAWPLFTESEVAHVISYLYYLRYLGTPGNVSRGERYLHSKGCFSCHSVGEKGGDMGPELDRLKKYASPIYVVQAIWNHGPEMQAMMEEMGIERPTFTGQEIADIGAFIRAVSQSPMRESVYLSPGNPNDGKLVFTQKRCDTCHSVHGVGGTAGPSMNDVDLNMSATGIAAVMWNHGAEMLSTMQEERLRWPTFDGKEMADLIAYLYFIKFADPSGDASRGQVLFEEKRCVLCHSVNELGGDIGPDLAERLAKRHGGISILTTMLNHAAKMSETVLSEGEKWPVLSGQEMRDIFAYLRTTAAKHDAD